MPGRIAARFCPFIDIGRDGARLLLPAIPILARDSGLHLREEEHFLDGLLAGEEHHQTIDADAYATGRGHPVAERVDEVVVDHLRLKITPAAPGVLFLEPGFLVEWVVQLREAVCHLHTGDEELEPLCQPLLLPVLFCKRRVLDGKVVDKRRLDEVSLAEVLEEEHQELPQVVALS